MAPKCWWMKEWMKRVSDKLFVVIKAYFSYGFDHSPHLTHCPAHRDNYYEECSTDAHWCCLVPYPVMRTSTWCCEMGCLEWSWSCALPASFLRPQQGSSWPPTLLHSRTIFVRAEIHDRIFLDTSLKITIQYQKWKFWMSHKNKLWTMQFIWHRDFFQVVQNCKYIFV